MLWLQGLYGPYLLMTDWQERDDSCQMPRGCVYKQDALLTRSASGFKNGFCSTQSDDDFNMSWLKYDVFYNNSVDEQMDIYSLRVSKHDYDLHSLYFHHVWPPDLSACWRLSTQGGQCIVNDSFIAHFLWLRCFY